MAKFQLGASVLRHDSSQRGFIIEVAPARRGPFNFSVCEIPVGADLVYVDDPNVKVKVLDDRHIEYQGETTSLSGLAQRLKGFNHPVQGTLWFKYNGEILADLRDRLGK